MSNNIFFTSDTHFGHANIIKYCNRPFIKAGVLDDKGFPVVDVEAHDEKLIENWNKVVKAGDRVYHLGDFGFGKAENLLKVFNRLNGQKYLIEGNHDDSSLDERLEWIWIKDTHNLKVGDKSYFLAHYAHRVWNKSFHGARHVFGHSHGMIKPWGWSCDVGTDCWEYTPVHADTLEALFVKLPRYEESASGAMPDGQIWQGRECMLSFQRAFFGDGTYDNVDPDELVKKDPNDLK
jgi:calcineurin-like phosphoesterase family protein